MIYNTASAYFNENWQRYQSALAHNTLYHREMMETLKNFLVKHMANRPFSMVDIGCGDCSAIVPILADTSIDRYIGIDAAVDVLKIAAQNLSTIPCEKEFIADNMLTAVPNLSEPVDIIFSSYAIHHLFTDEKMELFESCKQKLKTNGFLIMIDGVLKPQQSRQLWLQELEERMVITNPDLSAEEITIRMQHPIADDHPDTIATFAGIAKKQSWSDFKVLVDKEIFAFILFAK